MKIISASSSIAIEVNHKAAFAYIANLENDLFWRKEINSTRMSAEPGLGVRAIEDSFLSNKVPSNVLELSCTVYIENEQVVYQTVSNSNFYLKTIRRVDSVGHNACRMSYHLLFEKKLVQHAVGFNLPTFMIDWVTKRDMKRYLKNLKILLEQRVAAIHTSASAIHT